MVGVYKLLKKQEKTYQSNLAQSVEVKQIMVQLAKNHVLSSSVVEQSAVNRSVVGSNPTWGVKYFDKPEEIIPKQANLKC